MISSTVLGRERIDVEIAVAVQSHDVGIDMAVVAVRSTVAAGAFEVHRHEVAHGACRQPRTHAVLHHRRQLKVEALQDRVEQQLQLGLWLKLQVPQLESNGCRQITTGTVTYTQSQQPQPDKSQLR